VRGSGGSSSANGTASKWGKKDDLVACTSDQEGEGEDYDEDEMGKAFGFGGGWLGTSLLA